MASTGVYGSKDVAQAAEKMAHYTDTVEPNSARHERYREVAEVQRKLYPRLQDIFEDLHDLARKYPSTKPKSPAAELKK